jgi:biopolymer transport protein ExbD
MRLKNDTNAGPMADIAFLLLVFFLVATTINGEKGIQRKLPEISEFPGKPHAKRNTLVLLVNNQNKIMVNEQEVDLYQISSLIKKFVINNGANKCNYCDGSQDPNSSDHPSKALIGIDVQTETSYDIYVAIQDEINKAFFELRDAYAKQYLGKPYKDLDKAKQKEIRTKFPLLLSENLLRLN